LIIDKTLTFFFSLTKSPVDPRRRPTGSERLDLGILGSRSPRTLRIHEFKNPWIPRILGFLDIPYIYIFFLFGLSSRVSKSADSSDRRIPGPRALETSWTRADPRIPRRCQGKVVAGSRELDRSGRT